MVEIWFETVGINKVKGIVLYIYIKVISALKSDWILRNKSPLLRFVKTSPIVEETSVGVELTAGIGVSRRRTAGHITEGVVIQTRRNVATGVRQHPSRLLMIGKKIMGSSRTRLPQSVIDV
jgi:hypothetical protein